jgi:hypothetical protein
MTAQHQQRSTELMHELISSCRHAQERFRCAAETVTNEEWRRLFSIYAQQRTRFAEELRQHLPAQDGDDFSSGADATGYARPEWDDVLQECLDADQKSLETYSRALAARSMPTKAHFLVSAQFSLLQRVHERVRGLCAEKAEAV